MERVREALLILLLTAGCSQNVPDRTGAPAPPEPALSEERKEPDLDPEIVARIQEILVSEVGMEVPLDSHLVDDLHTDSLDMVEIIMKVEEEFDVEIRDEDLENLGTVRALALWIEEKTSSRR